MDIQYALSDNLQIVLNLNQTMHYEYMNNYHWQLSHLTFAHPYQNLDHKPSHPVICWHTSTPKPEILPQRLCRWGRTCVGADVHASHEVPDQLELPRRWSCRNKGLDCRPNGNMEIHLATLDVEVLSYDWQLSMIAADSRSSLELSMPHAEFSDAF